MRSHLECAQLSAPEETRMSGSVTRESGSLAQSDIDSLAEARNPKIVVVGCGGGGTNSIHRLNKIGVYGAQTVAINTDHIHLKTIGADRKILIGRSITKGFGAGGLPDVGERCAKLSEDEIREAVAGADMTFVVASMGGGTGTGVAPFVSQLAKKEGSIVIGFATTPFKAERGRERNAMIGLDNFRKHADSVIVLENDRLLKIVPNLEFEHALSVMDQLISEVIKGITEAITMPSLINLDLADVRTVVTSGGPSTILYGEDSAENPENVVANTLNNPFFEVDYSQATSALIHITTGPSSPISTVHEVIEGITSRLNDHAHVIIGVRNDDRDYDEIIKVVTVITGARSSNLLGPDAGAAGRHVRSLADIAVID